MGLCKTLSTKRQFYFFSFSLNQSSLRYLDCCIRENRMSSNPGFCFCFFFFLSFSSITRTFASGKTEKVIFQALKELGLPSGKVFTDLTVFLKPLSLLFVHPPVISQVTVLNWHQLEPMTQRTVHFPSPLSLTMVTLFKVFSNPTISLQDNFLVNFIKVR